MSLPGDSDNSTMATCKAMCKKKRCKIVLGKCIKIKHLHFLAILHFTEGLQMSWFMDRIFRFLLGRQILSPNSLKKLKNARHVATLSQSCQLVSKIATVGATIVILDALYSLVVRMCRNYIL